MRRKEDVRAFDIDSVEIYKCFRPGDVVRAAVISLGDSKSYYLSTARNELGVILANSTAGNNRPRVSCIAEQSVRVLLWGVTPRVASSCVVSMHRAFYGAHQLESNAMSRHQCGRVSQGGQITTRPPCTVSAGRLKMAVSSRCCSFSTNCFGAFSWHVSEIVGQVLFCFDDRTRMYPRTHKHTNDTIKH